MAESSELDRKLDPDAMPPLLKSLFAGQRPDGVIAGVNDDDCAVLGFPGKLLIVTTDFLNARPIAIELGIGNYETLGRLVVAANLSDLCGTGALPEALLIAVTMNRTATQRDFQELMMGVKKEARRWKVFLICEALRPRAPVTDHASAMQSRPEAANPPSGSAQALKHGVMPPLHHRRVGSRPILAASRHRSLSTPHPTATRRRRSTNHLRGKCRRTSVAA